MECDVPAARVPRRVRLGHDLTTPLPGTFQVRLGLDFTTPLPGTLQVRLGLDFTAPLLVRL